MDSRVGVAHYHIHWSNSKFDWQPFSTPEGARIEAERLAVPGETFTIDQFDDNCARCEETTSHLHRSLYRIEVRVVVYPNLLANSRIYSVLVVTDSEKTAESKASEIVRVRHADSRITTRYLGLVDHAILDESEQTVVEVG